MKSIRLIEPVDGSMTEPLQQYSWTEARSASQEILVDRGLPRPVSFAWEPLPVADGAPTYDLLISREPDFGDPLIFADLAAPGVEVVHLFVGTPYGWKVVARHAGQQLGESPVWRFSTHCDLPRWIKVPGITNVRDLGGWPLPGNRRVRQGVVYRSSEMNNLRPIAAEGKEVLERELGIRTDLDLRWSTHEDVGPVLDPDQVRWINIPILGYGRLDEEADRLNYPRVFELFAEPANYPILLHCAAGADRAGTIAFMLNALLGVSAEDLFRDYELTSLSRAGERSCSSDVFQSLLEALAPWGDDFSARAESYLGAVGVTPDTIDAIRAQLTVGSRDS